jgi:HSP20 family protein
MASRDPYDWMWTEACAFIERAERLHRQFFCLAMLPARPPGWEPPVDMYETADALWLLVALPGVPPERL